MKQFIKRLAGFSLGPILGAAISFLLFPIFINLLPVTEYGRAGSFQSVLIQIPAFVYLGLDQAYAREFNQYSDERHLIQQAMTPPLIVGVLLAIVGTIYSGPIAAWTLGDASYNYIVIYGLFWILITVIERFLQLHIRMEERALEYSIFTLLVKVGNFIVSMILIMLGWRDFRVVVYGLIFGTVLADSILFYKYRHLMDLSHYRWDKDLMRLLFSFGLPVMIAASLSSLLNLMDIAFLTEFSDYHNIGIYKAGSQLAAVLGIMKTAFVSFWVPTAYRWHTEARDIKHYKYISDLILFGMSGIYFVLLIMKYPIATILNPSQNYLELMYIVGLLAFPHLMYTLSETTTLGIVFSRKTHYNIIVSVLAVLTSFLLNYSLTPIWGYRGAALASTAAYFVFYLSRTYFSKKTGFYFGQGKQLLVICLMLIAGFINLYPHAYSTWVTAVMFVVALLIQWSTFKVTLDIRNHPDQWDFS